MLSLGDACRKACQRYYGIAFSGGIGENAAQIRSGNCQDPGQIGIEIDETGLTDGKWQLVNERPA